MAEETKIETTEVGQKTRRAFVTSAAKVAVTAPAVGLLLSGTTMPAAAAISEYQASVLGILDDYTFGNTNEDIDAIASQSNTNPLNGSPEQDDVWNPIP